jgi:phosphoglycolate phosphatase-like HAD superfamily hydrolase
MKTKPIIAIDIDGTLGDHFEWVARFAEMWTGHEIKYDPPKGWPDDATKFQFNRALGLSKHTYRKVKLAYRQGGMKRSMPCFEGASELTRGLRRAGAEVWITTSRPYLRLDNIDPDTRHWLARNRIQYDSMLYGDRKYLDLVRQVEKGDVVAVLDDLPEMCMQAMRAGLHPVMIRRPHNEGSAYAGQIVESLTEAREKLEGMLHER